MNRPNLPPHLLTALSIISLLLITTAVTFAHAELESTYPEPGAVLSNPIGEIELTFNDHILVASEITLFADNFQAVPNVSKKFSTAEPNILRATVPELDPGTYTVQYTAVAEDGHEISGSYAFRVSNSNLPVSSQHLWILGLGILLATGIVVLWRRSDKRTTDIPKR